ncbi:hypothetical protein D3C71_1439280 [compost metagenome]
MLVRTQVFRKNHAECSDAGLTLVIGLINPEVRTLHDKGRALDLQAKPTQGIDRVVGEFLFVLLDNHMIDFVIGDHANVLELSEFPDDPFASGSFLTMRGDITTRILVDLCENGFTRSHQLDEFHPLRNLSRTTAENSNTLCSNRLSREQ